MQGEKMTLKYDWTLKELQQLDGLPLLELISRANAIHVKYHKPGEMQVGGLISIKTGGCPEDCKYCAQSSRYQTPVAAEPMLSYDTVLAEAKRAIARGATRVCLGAAWREARNSKQFDDVLAMVRGITALGAEVCCTLGMLKPEQAKRLKDAGLYAYNHNLDSSENHYKNFVTTRTYQDRLDTLDVVEKAGLSLCCGGILGLGESATDRLELLLALCRRNPHPDSVPINRLIRVPGTPYEHLPEVTIWEVARMVALARIALPRAMVRFSAGRQGISFEGQALCFLAGANSIWLGEKLLTMGNPSTDKDEEMFKILGLSKRPGFIRNRE